MRIAVESDSRREGGVLNDNLYPAYSNVSISGYNETMDTAEQTGLVHEMRMFSIYRSYDGR